jgi:hypothetical protein
MNKYISTVILAAFTAVYSLGATAADTSSKDKDKGGTSKYDSPQEWKDKYGKGGKGDDSTSQIMQNETAKDLAPSTKYENRDQEVMNKKPYKEPK